MNEFQSFFFAIGFVLGLIALGLGPARGGTSQPLTYLLDDVEVVE